MILKRISILNYKNLEMCIRDRGFVSSQNLFCFILINHGFLYIVVSGNKYFFPEKLSESMKQWHLFCVLPLMAACDSGQSGSGELISVDLRQGIDHPSMLNLQDEVEKMCIRDSKGLVRIISHTSSSVLLKGPDASNFSVDMAAAKQPAFS